MLTKSCIKNVILINWKGIFFHPFSIDSGLTTLEGGNGTGKTTVMIAAYICLIPDLKYLNFQNVTTLTGRKSEDKGLYGRLGKGDLVFSILDILTVDGKRHLMGVKLIKQNYPRVTLKHFAIQDLDHDADLEDILLKDISDTNQQEIIDIQEIGERSKKYNGRLVNFRYVKDYFRFMFDNGITPLRLTENDERKQYNQLLSTSLYGGLSRSLQSSLREYLMPEDNTLISSLQDMENNLLSCRRTRSAINRYHSIREVLQNVYQTGLEMFSSAFWASRLESEQTLRKALFLRKEYRLAKARGQKLLAELSAAGQETKKREEERSLAAREWMEAKERLDKCQSARNIRRQMELKNKEWEKQREIEQQAREKQGLIHKKVEDIQAQTRESTKRQVELAEQLSDASQAWDTLSTEVGLFLRANKLLKQAQKLWDENISPENASEWLKKAEEAFRQSQEEHKKTYRLWKEANLKHEHFKTYHKLLEDILEQPISYQDSVLKADEEISNFYKQEERLQKENALSGQILDLELLISKQKQTRQWLKQAGLVDIDSSEKLEAAWQESIRRSKGLESVQNRNYQSISQKEQEIQLIDSRLPEHKAKLEQWERFQDWKQQLEDSAATDIDSLSELTSLNKSLDDQLRKFTMNKFRLEVKLEEYNKLFKGFSQSEASDSRLNKLVEQGYGDLLADRYENIPLEWSANMESRLGPLTQALVVENAEETALKLADNQDRPEVLWMVEQNQSEKLPESLEISDSLLVRHGQAWRFGRLPEFPFLGKEARRQRIDALREKIKLTSRELENNFLNIQQTEKNKSLLDKLVPLANLLENSSPLAQIKELQNKKIQLQTDLEQLREDKIRISENFLVFKNQGELLQKCFPYKDLLDRPQTETERKSLIDELEQINTLKTRRQYKKAKITQLSRGIEVLSEPPLENYEQLRTDREKLREEEENWRLKLELMQTIQDNLKYFKFADQAPLLERRKGLTRHIKERLADIRLKQEDAEKLLKSYTQLQTEAERRLYKEEKLSLNLNGQISQLKQNLLDMGLEGYGEDLNRAENMIRETAKKKEEKDSALNHIKKIVFRLEAEDKIAGENTDKAQKKFKKFYPSVKPTLSYWRIFRRQAQKDGIIQKLLAEYFTSIHKDTQEPEVFWRRESASRAALLKITERLTDAGSLLERIKSINSGEDNTSNKRNYQCVAIWEEIRGYVNQVIPMDMQNDDLEQVQRQIILKLENLRINLENQENSLLNYIEAIPNHIMAQIRKQKSRIRRLNQQLEKVKFGFLETIRINIEMQSQLKEFLLALPEKLDYFTKKADTNPQAADLIASLYEEMGAGKVKGDLLLDYRHYLALNIEVKREGSSRFEKVTSSNLSTGESIGVGMAILIMMLMSWEEQSCLLRNTEKPVGLRFLLLDESSRLDQKALRTLSDFCRHLDLQLLIAAPSVEKTLEGTTHHLTRGHFDGREEVIVRGRRFTKNPEEEKVAV